MAFATDVTLQVTMQGTSRTLFLPNKDGLLTSGIRVRRPEAESTSDESDVDGCSLGRARRRDVARPSVNVVDPLASHLLPSKSTRLARLLSEGRPSQVKADSKSCNTFQRVGVSKKGQDVGRNTVNLDVRIQA